VKKKNNSSKTQNTKSDILDKVSILRTEICALLGFYAA
jgi:hypothetical protein